jgi:type IV pilus assembly protein PilN
MIRINLVPVKEKKKRKELFIIFWVAAFFVVVALAMTWIYVQRKAVEKDLDNQIVQVKEEAKKYEEKIKEIKQLEANEANLTAYKTTVKGITETQRKVISVVDQLGLALPDGVWLTRLTQGRDADQGKFTVEGYAFSPGSLNSFVTKLQRARDTFKEVKLSIKSVLTSVGNNRQIHQFEITAKAVDQGS